MLRLWNCLNVNSVLCYLRDPMSLYFYSCRRQYSSEIGYSLISHYFSSMNYFLARCPYCLHLNYESVNFYVAYFLQWCQHQQTIFTHPACSGRICRPLKAWSNLHFYWWKAYLAILHRPSVHYVEKPIDWPHSMTVGYELPIHSMIDLMIEACSPPRESGAGRRFCFGQRYYMQITHSLSRIDWRS